MAHSNASVKGMPSARHLLLIGGNDATAEAVSEAATSRGIIVHVADGCANAIEGYGRLRPCCVVIDLETARDGAIEVLRYLGTVDREVHVVLSTGGHDRIVDAAMRLGAHFGLSMDAELPKPLDSAALGIVIDRVVAGKSDPITEPQLYQAINADELVLFYQPKVALLGSDSGRIVGVEALVRWDRPGRGLVPPNDFIPLAESSGLVVPLTWRVLDMALEQMALWAADGLDLKVAVNMSSVMLSDRRIVDRIAERVHTCGVAPSRIILEVTETAGLVDRVNAIDILTRLRLRDFELSLDDFGTGYSSMLSSYQMPFSEVKLDMSFVREVDVSEEARIIVKASTEIAHSLGMTICAEGVETESARDYLASLGIETAQGYLFSRPVPAGELTALVRSGRFRPAVTETRPAPSMETDINELGAIEAALQSAAAGAAPYEAPKAHRDDEGDRTWMPGSVSTTTEGANAFDALLELWTGVRQFVEQDRPYDAISACEDAKDLAYELPDAATWIERIDAARGALQRRLGFEGDAVLDSPDRRFVLIAGTDLNIGRPTRATAPGLPINCRMLSRGGHQTRVALEDGGFVVTDQDSRNGTYVGERLLDAGEAHRLYPSGEPVTLRLGGGRKPPLPGPCAIDVRQFGGGQPVVVLNVALVAPEGVAVGVDQWWPTRMEDCATTYVLVPETVDIGDGEDSAIRLRCGSGLLHATMTFANGLSIAPAAYVSMTVDGAPIRQSVVLRDGAVVALGDAVFEVRARSGSAKPSCAKTPAAAAG